MSAPGAWGTSGDGQQAGTAAAHWMAADDNPGCWRRSLFGAWGGRDPGSARGPWRSVRFTIPRMCLVLWVAWGLGVHRAAGDPAATGAVGSDYGEGLIVGYYQLGQAGPMCSFWSCLLDGPLTGRGRNEGRLKTPREIHCLVPLWDWVAEWGHAYDAGHGQTWAEYEPETRSPLTLNLCADALETVAECEQRGLVPVRRLQRLRQYLAQCDFLNVDTLLAARASAAFSPAQARTLFFLWFARIGSYPSRNVYVHPGNSRLCGKLVDAQVLAAEEARFFLRLWLVELDRIHYSMLEDVEALAGVTPTELGALVRREQAALAEMAARAGLDLLPPGVSGREWTQEVKAADDEIRRLQRRLRREARRPSSLPEWFP